MILFDIELILINLKRSLARDGHLSVISLPAPLLLSVNWSSDLVESWLGVGTQLCDKEREKLYK